jgi:predicted nucleotidyltransferase
MQSVKILSISLCGSRFRLSAWFWSDIDVVIVKETTKPFSDRALEFVGLFDLGVAVDILVYTSEEIRRLDREPTSFWKAAMQTKIQVL